MGSLMKTNDAFWAALDSLAAESEVVIDRPKNSAHPRYPSYVYPMDYGYLRNTTSMDGGGIDIWRGSEPTGAVVAVVCTVDLVKRDSEIKILLGCTEAEIALVHQTHNESEFMKGLLIRRDT